MILFNEAFCNSSQAEHQPSPQMDIEHMPTCKSYFKHNSRILACKKTDIVHTMMHMDTQNIKSNTISWGSDAPDVISSPVGARYYAIRGKDDPTDHQAEYSYMGIKDSAARVGTEIQFATGPFAYEGEEEWKTLQEEARQMTKDWDDKIALLDAEAVNTDTFFVEISANEKSIKLRPSEYTYLFDNKDQIEPSDFDAREHVVVYYPLPNVKIYDGRTASELHEDFLKLIAPQAEKLFPKDKA